MAARAPRRRLRPWRAPARGASLMLGLWLAGIGLAQGAQGAEITAARYTHPTKHYAHGVLGDRIEYAGLSATLADGRELHFRFAPNAQVFEDIAPRLWDVTGDGAPELVVIETDPPVGAQLAVYAVQGQSLKKIAATPYIGRTHRWLAPIGAADLDGDGRVEIAYIDRPHLAKIMRLWRFSDGRLSHLVDVPGLTNHRIGDNFISSGLRVCSGQAELITADKSWRKIIATRFDGQKVTRRALGPFSAAALRRALKCN